LELFRRARAALITFDAAVQQAHDSVACILYVVAAECLVMPHTEWRRSKLTKRFIEFLDELMPTELDQIVAHANFEETFGIRRGGRSPRALPRPSGPHMRLPVRPAPRRLDSHVPRLC
jgi:hypothetical protein